MQFSSQLIGPGSETQINLKPEITYTTEDVISIFSPKKRGCYSEGEANLTHLPYGEGYRYEMNNCLIDQGIGNIIWHCRCVPSIWQKFCRDNDYYDTIANLPYCSGTSTNFDK